MIGLNVVKLEASRVREFVRLTDLAAGVSYFVFATNSQSIILFLLRCSNFYNTEISYTFVRIKTCSETISRKQSNYAVLNQGTNNCIKKTRNCVLFTRQSKNFRRVVGQLSPANNRHSTTT